jgi:serine/threonine protein phosphatase 1
MKLYVCSDIHGFFDEFKKALDEAGFEENNPEHLLIVCGDCFDRGKQPAEVIHYLMKLKNKVLVKGNHEDLLLQCIEREYPYSNDYSNGTYGTICELGGAGEGRPFDECCLIAEQRIKPFIRQMVDYYETKNYIFVHSFIPTIEDWRYAHASQWEEARWGNPFKLVKQGSLPDKTLVFGHWHCSAGWAEKEGISEFGEDAKFDAFYGDGYISIDACTAHSHRVNIIVIEDDLMEDDNNGT